MNRLIATVLVASVFLTGCVTATNVTFDSSPPGADVFVDGEFVGRTPVSRRIGNGFWVDPTIRVELDGHVPVSADIDKELKGINLALGIALWLPALLWVSGPQPRQFYALRAASDRAAETPSESAPDRESDGGIVTQTLASIRRILENGRELRLAVVAATDADEGAMAAHVDSITVELLDAFGSDPLFTVVNRESTAEVLSELDFQFSGLVDDEQISEYGRLSGANYLLITDYERQELESVLTVSDRRRLVEVETGTVFASDIVQITMIWDVPSAQYRVVSSTHNGRPMTIIGGRMFSVDE